MGITGLWTILGEGEVCSIADYAATFFKEHNRPLRIAVDDACWRFTNLTPEQVHKIQEQEPAANPVEKVILCKLVPTHVLEDTYTSFRASLTSLEA